MKNLESVVHPLAIGFVSGFMAIGIIWSTGFEYATSYLFLILSLFAFLLAGLTTIKPKQRHIKIKNETE